MSDTVRQYEVTIFEAAIAPHRSAHAHNILRTEEIDNCMKAATEKAIDYAIHHTAQEVWFRAGDTQVKLLPGQSAGDLRSAWYAQEKLDSEQLRAAPEVATRKAASRG